jgi:SAM-dependent methyltransferase
MSGMKRHMRTVEDVMRFLDRSFESDRDRWSERGAPWWDQFYADRHRPVPFFNAGPDESLVDWHERALLSPQPGATAFDIGCGAGRNARWLASRGYSVDAIDLSATAIDWANEDARGDARVRFTVGNVFEFQIPMRGYDLVHDSGLFHHLPPHRRVTYLELLRHAVAPGGAFTLSCFASGEMGSEASDETFYDIGSLEGGLAYSDSDLCELFAEDFDLVELRRMNEHAANDERFGQPFLWVGLYRRRATRLVERQSE